MLFTGYIKILPLCRETPGGIKELNFKVLIKQSPDAVIT